LVGRIVGIQQIDIANLISGEQRELIFEERVAFALSGSVYGNENRAFVCVVAVDGGEFDKVSFAVGGHGEIADYIAVESGSVHVERRVLSAREGSVDVLGLKVSGV
jgi:hypothetical protein